jgi:Tol biopolymer transport system component/DNA-binding winged helix-turn-helix (wHTH) protein
LSEERYRFGDVEFDRGGFRLTRAGRPVRVEPKVLEVLAHLIDNRGRLVEKRELLGAVWGDTAVSEGALTRAIAQLRKAIGDDAREGRYLETVPTRGYRFLAEVATVGNGAETGPVLPPDAAPTPRKRRRAWTVLSLALVALTVSALAGWWIGHERGSRPRPQPRRVLVSSWIGFNGFPTFSPDGGSLAFASDRSGKLEIYVRPLAPGAREVQVTTDGHGNVQPAWSPDGRLVAYHSMTRGGVWIVPALGGPARRLTEFGSRPAWSPDGRQIAFQSLSLADLPAISQTPATLWVVPAAGGAPRQVTRAGEPRGGHGSHTWSADGQRLAFVADGVWTVELDGNGLRRVSEARAASDAIFSPGGTLYWSAVSPREGRILRARLGADGQASGATEELLDTASDRARHLALSRDGRRLAYALTSMSSSVVSLPLTPAGEPAGSPAPLTRDSRGRKVAPVFSPDGRHVAYLTFRAGEGSEVWVVDTANGEASQILPSMTVDSIALPDWFPTSDRVGVVTRTGDALRYLSVSLAGETKALMELTGDVGHARLLRDGSGLVFHSQRDGRLNVWRADFESGQVRQLTFDDEGAGWPVPSPDGQSIAVELFRGPDTTQVAVIPAAGGQARAITTAPGQHWAHGWSPDGQRISYVARHDGAWNVHWVSLSGEERRLTDYTDVRTFVRYPTWSPKGDRLAYERTEVKADLWVMDLPE